MMLFELLTITAGRGSCEGCGLPVSGERVYCVPNLPGVYCSMACVETKLFGQEHCRWCSRKMERPYTGIESRLCGEDCRTNYFAHVLGDYTAGLGNGKRLLLWLQHHQPGMYRQIIGGSVKPTGYCQNPSCPRGENGEPASLEHLRSGAKFCCEACSEQARRNVHSRKVLTGHFDPSQARQKCGFSRHASGEMGLGVNPPIFDVSRHARTEGAQR